MHLRFAFVLSSVAALAVSAHASTPRQAMDQRAREFEKAMMNRNTTWFQNVATPDFVAIDQAGKKTSIKDAMQQITMMFQLMKSITSVSETILTCQASGKTIHLTQEVKMAGTIPGQGGKISQLTDDSKSAETWVLVGTQWKIKLEKSLSDVMKVDGNPVSAGG